MDPFQASYETPQDSCSLSSSSFHRSRTAPPHNRNHHPSSHFVQTSKTAALVVPSTTMPDDDFDMQELKRTSSGGLLFLRKKSAHQKEKISRARAQEISVLFELSDEKEMDLNKKASFKNRVVMAPKLSVNMTAKQAAAILARKQVLATQNFHKATVDPLLTERERKEKQRKEKIEQRKAVISERLSPCDQLSHPPLLQGQPQQPRIAASSSAKLGYVKMKNLDCELPEAIGMEVISTSPGSVTVAPTVIETPSPKAPQAFGCYDYDLPNMC